MKYVFGKGYVYICIKKFCIYVGLIFRNIFEKLLI